MSAPSSLKEQLRQEALSRANVLGSTERTQEVDALFQRIWQAAQDEVLTEQAKVAAIVRQLLADSATPFDRACSLLRNHFPMP